MKLIIDHAAGNQAMSALTHAVEIVSSKVLPMAQDGHPFWIFESSPLHDPEVFLCVPVLFLAGLLCSAGGIGGGGVYVTLLMVVGNLRPRDAVPLSKAIVFLGSLASLILNLRKMATTTPGAARAPSLIDYSICRVVVPASLMGTLLGVLFNRIASDWVVVGSLCVVLGAMSIMVSRTWVTQRAFEELEDVAKAAPEDSVQLLANEQGGSDGQSPSQSICAPKKRAIGTCSKQDIYISLGLLFTVILCGVLRAHASACRDEIHDLHGTVRKACHHPINHFFYRQRLEGWMTRPFVADAFLHTYLVLPICLCLAVMIYTSRSCIKEGWTLREVAVYEAMGVTTGCLAGLVGIGGGLIFSPFFLVLGVDPHVAVATSSTCVIFTSSSTTLQYLFTDRVITSLAFIYGIVNLAASWAGTSFVHYLQDNYNTRKSYITAIVAAGVFLSTVLSIIKLVTTHHAMAAPAAPGHSLHA